MNRHALIAVLPLLFVASLAWAGPAAWTGQVPFGGYVTSVVVNPNNPSRLFATTANGFFRSVDGGLSWQRAEIAVWDRSTLAQILRDVVQGGSVAQRDGAAFYGE